MGTPSDMDRLLPSITAHNAAVEEVSKLLRSSKIDPAVPMRIESLEASRATRIKAAKAVRKLHKFMKAVYDEYALILEEWNEKHMPQIRN